MVKVEFELPTGEQVSRSYADGTSIAIDGPALLVQKRGGVAIAAFPVSRVLCAEVKEG